MNFTESLKKNFQFRYVYNRGRSIANRHLVMYVVKNGAQGNKLGISVSKKVGKSVVRSHVTRPGYDIVVIARVICKDATYHEVNASLRHLLKKHQLLLSHQENHQEKNCEKEIENEER